MALVPGRRGLLECRQVHIDNPTLFRVVGYGFAQDFEIEAVFDSGCDLAGDWTVADRFDEFRLARPPAFDLRVVVRYPQ